MTVLRAILAVSLISVTVAENLTFVTVLYRHGDRAPSTMYPTDPHSPSFWPNGLGQLTNLGKNHMYELGKFIRNRYQDFLPVTYHTEDLQVLSSDVDRTIMSALCVLAGLYEPVGSDVWLESIKWQPIPVHSISQKVDNLILNYYRPCPKFDQLLDNQMSHMNLSKRHQEVINEVLNHTGIPMSSNFRDTFLNISNVCDCLLIEKKYGLKLPDWTKNYFPQPLRDIRKFILGVKITDVPMKRLRCGPLLKDIIKHMEEVVGGKSKIKMRQYSGHDQTLVDIMRCLKVYDWDLVPMSSAIFLEIYKVEENFKVAINFKKDKEVKRLIITGCETHCPFDTFKKLMEDVLPDDWENECKL